MNTSGEAADQVVRMSLEVGEAALKISGTGAKHLAVMLYAVLKEKKKTKGRVRLETLVKSGRPLTVFSVKESDLKQFVQEAKRYGVLYCAVRNPRGSSYGLEPGNHAAFTDSLFFDRCKEVRCYISRYGCVRRAEGITRRFSFR